MTMTRPWRRMILHLLQIFFTLGLTFTANSPLARLAGRLASSAQAPGLFTCIGRRCDRG
jgi:hypothetical protein